MEIMTQFIIYVITVPRNHMH